MSRTPQRRGGAASLFSTPQRSPYRSPHKTVALKGNCKPRLPAAHFQVKKDGRNQGRWFYTCQKPKEEGCGFFLWDDDAVGREMRAVINNSRTEPDGLRTPADAMREGRAVEVSGSKWTQCLGKDDEDEFGEFPLSAEDVEKVTENIIHHEPQPAPYPETPRKAIKTDPFTTLGSKRKWAEDALPTPVTNTSKDEDVFTSSTGRLKGHMWDGNERFGLRSPSATPTPSRFRHASESEDVAEEKPKNFYDITQEVMDLLKDQHIDEDTSASLRQLLGKHALQVSGIAKGRDITRVALKTKDAKIAELQQKITTLTTEREMDRTVIRHFKSDMAESIASRGGRGRGRDRGNS
ncbi:DNA topoisomerase III alpha [Hyphodiscus hymeniophilus]|uniref:DNA topoisomerase III alpha n=1 Tax=Hyphodiscus hymeniophilus TaxID=353542 RepID=A0A9P6VHL8_9HELO|nr:DNA topoisomerase III alpha [Hyphodiscus hymeniophilus]